MRCRIGMLVLMTRDLLVRKLRSLRRLERRLRGRGPVPGGTLFDRFLAFEPGRRVRYPFSVLLALDEATRKRAFREFAAALWAESGALDLAWGSDAELLETLGLPADADRETVRRAFRELALELHPDLGGDHDLMVTLLSRFRGSSYG